MFFITTNNKLYYHGENTSGRGGLGHSNKVTGYEEVEIFNENGAKINALSIVDFVEYYRSSAILTKEGDVYVACYSSKFTKINISNIVQICPLNGSLLLLNKDGEIFSLANGVFSPINKITTVYNNNVSEPIKKIKKIGASDYAQSSYSYLLAYYIDEDDTLYTYNMDFTRNNYKTGYFNKCLDNVYKANGYYTTSNNGYMYAIDKDGVVYCCGGYNGIAAILSKLTVIGREDLNFKIHNTGIQATDIDIVDFLYIEGNPIMIYKHNGTLKYALGSQAASYISGEYIHPGNKFQEVIPNENNFNFERFEPIILRDSAYHMMYMWEKDTGDLYMAGRDYTSGTGTSTSLTLPLTKVELPNGEKIKKLSYSHLYHDYNNITVPTYDYIVTASMLPDGAFDTNKSGFKVWDGEKYDRALFVEEMEEFYELDITKAKKPIKVNTSEGEKLLATTNMILYPKWIEEESDEILEAIVGEAIVGKSNL